MRAKTNLIPKITQNKSEWSSKFPKKYLVRQHHARPKMTVAFKVESAAHRTVQRGINTSHRAENTEFQYQ